jgi:hypothetical protein
LTVLWKKVIIMTVLCFSPPIPQHRSGMALSSSGLGRVPLKDEITGSNPVSATKNPLPHWSLANTNGRYTILCGQYKNVIDI